MGLLSFDLDDQQKRQLRALALAQFGFGLAGARKGQEGQALGRAGLLATEGYQRGLLDTEQQNMRRHLFQQKQAEDAERERVRKGLDSARQAATMPAMGPPSPDGQMQPGGFDLQRFGMEALPFNMQAGLAALKEHRESQPKPDEYGTSFQNIIGPDGKPIAVQPRKSGGYSTVGAPYEKPASQWEFVGKTPDGQILLRNKDTQELRAVGSPAQRVSFSMPPMETEEAKGIGKARAEAFVGLTQKGQAANAKLNQLQAIESILGNTETNALTPIGMQISGAARAFGVDIDPKLPLKQAADSIMNQMALNSRSTGEGGGMPGALSDKDREFLKAMNPNLAQTPGGRKLIIEVQRRTARREQEVAELARQYRKQKGTFDEGFADVLSAWAAKHPLFDDLPMPQSGGQAGGGQIRRYNPQTGRIE